MRISGTKLVDMVFRYMDEDTKMLIQNYIIDKSKISYITFLSREQIDNFFNQYMELVNGSFRSDALSDLLTYTGYEFSNINAVLRDNWKYDVNGNLGDENSVDYRKLSNNISNIIGKMPDVSFDFITFRGATVSSFKDYGITNLNGFLNLKGKFLYEQGFTSTSILESTCYFGANSWDGKNYNVKIRYKIASGCKDGIFLFNNQMSFSPNQNEYLLDKDTLSYVENVIVDDENDCAYLTVIVIPKRIWNGLVKDEIDTRVVR